MTTMPPANNGSTKTSNPPVVQIQSRNSNPEPNGCHPVVSISNSKASIPSPSRRKMKVRKEKANDQNREIPINL
ncbi:hypothetical protein Tco_0894233 [Tanacetum coccineum]|uniref:Uncharacterized protein n=1 Tax=Tanacetum coccineum TaxID=301880 RepID=A0ABQ5CB65_9ASTR